MAETETSLARRARVKLKSLVQVGRPLLWCMTLASVPSLARCEEVSSTPPPQPTSVPSSAPAGIASPTSQPVSPDVALLKQLSLQDLMQVQVSTVSRINEPVDEAPGNVYVYPRTVIQNRGYHS